MKDIYSRERAFLYAQMDWREQNTEQLKDNLPKNNKTELEIKQILHRLISENIEKGEKDNISAVYVQQSEEGA